MKDFIMKVTPIGVDFLDEQDKAQYLGLISLMREKGIDKFVMRIEEHKKRTSQKQVNLWNALVSMIHLETGNDYNTINQTLNKTGKNVSEMNNEEFNTLLNNTFSTVYEYFGINLTINKNGNIEKCY